MSRPKKILVAEEKLASRGYQTEVNANEAFFIQRLLYEVWLDYLTPNEILVIQYLWKRTAFFGKTSELIVFSRLEARQGGDCRLPLSRRTTISTLSSLREKGVVKRYSSAVGMWYSINPAWNPLRAKAKKLREARDLAPACREQVGAERAPLKSVVEQFSNDAFTTSIVPLITKNPEWRNEPSALPRSVRQDVLDIFRQENLSWHGEMQEVEFLERIYDLRAMPSNDSRFSDASGDIWQHRVNNPEDWPENWVFTDDRFNLLGGGHQLFIKFICETLNPVVRRNKSEAVKLLNAINQVLEPAGWRIIEAQTIAGHSKYIGMKIDQASSRATARAKSVADALDAGWMHKEISRLENAIDTDPSLAIGTAKDLVESCCKSILTKLGTPLAKGTDFSTLTKTTVKELKLVPEGVSEGAKGAANIRVILSNLGAIAHGLAELRALYGSGHGRDGKYRGLEPRHARLAVAAAATFIDFVTETFNSRHKNETVSSVSTSLATLGSSHADQS